MPEPVVDDIVPSSHRTGVPTTVTINGQNFLSKIYRQLDDNSSFVEDDTFRVNLRASFGASDREISLSDVIHIDDYSLTARLPDDIPPGEYAAQVITPFGRRSAFAATLSVTDSAGMGSDADADTDTDSDSDVHADTDTDRDSDTGLPDTESGADDPIDDTDSASQADTGGVDIAYYPAGFIAVDGYLNEASWNPVTPIRQIVLGARDDNVYFDVLWTLQHLYIGVTTDDETLLNDSQDKWEDDSIDIVIDSNHDRGGEFDTYDVHFIKAYDDVTFYCSRETTLTFLHAAAALPGGGYSIELAIPWAFLNIVPSDGLVIGFDIGANDDDGDGSDTIRDNQIRWNASTDDWWNPSLFGEIVLINAFPPGK